MKKVIVNGVAYLGDLKKTTTALTLKNAMKSEDASKSSLAEYLRRENADELETVEFGGQGVSFTTSDLTEDEEMNLKIGEMVMKASKGKAVKNLENDLFSNMLGK